ncbi:DCP2-domain-containing protein [Wolfiporia cocos MD-104 SS10]|uniref:DCP2-domain-containing protein n=1 Tax=Wolfiporia cocos (strain MD-104) TaxID=742152 RepID=A0A2H3J7P2_WOLCO|nr:DCP2-domain-containing protein [Wolfiporia cocos MD-104 SS10]
MASSSSSSPEISSAPPASGSQSSVQYAHFSREEVLEELSSRFILNLPDEELASLERVCFQVEQAHWYYEDFIREQNPSKFPSYNLKTFSEALFRACPPLHHWAHDHERAFATFMQYKTRVPVCGAIMLNDTWEKCVLVKGWKSSAGWGFPKGKINEQEPRPRCAAREVLEETGYDLEGQINPDDVIELSIKEQSISLYIVPGVPEDFPFKTRTRKEISQIAWFKLSDLPTWRRSKAVPGKFYLISPFIGPLKAFIHDRKSRNPRNRGRIPQSVSNAQGAHVSGEEDSAILDACPVIASDPSGQESGSQSSSADNGELQTPSPQYSAPHVNVQPVDQAVESNDGGPAPLGIDGVDPHFARLLNSLSLSASSAPKDLDKTSLLPEPPSATTRADALDDSQLAQVQGKASERSMHGSNTQAGTSVVSAPSSSTSITPHRRTRSGVLNSSSQPAVGSAPSDRSSSHNSYTPTASPAVIPSGPAQHTGPDAVSPKLSPRASRAGRVSRASVDISPYHSRSRDIMKEMKYISMLESVARESDRRTSQLHSSSQSRAAQHADLLSTISGTTESIPPANSFGRVDSPLIYSSRPVAATLFPDGMSHVPRPIVPLDALQYDDPFTVRPRTSAAFHPLPYPSVTQKPGLDGEGLRYIPPGPGMAPRNAMSPQAFPQPTHLPLNGLMQPPFLSSGQESLGSRFPQAPLPPYPSVSTYGPPFPTGTPAHLNASRSANNAHLLAILNSPNPVPRPATAHPGFMSGMGH